MRIIAMAAVLAAGLGGVAAAQQVGGVYTVRGTNPNGSTYGGTARITPSGSACRIVWQTGSTTSSGICMLANRAFAAYYRLGRNIGLAVYELQPDGSLRGHWTIADTEGVGTEILTPR
ncbi:MAG: hypothetical protein KIT16_11615 [Rhodospirillaceae bacterium]|nr:hypothetical protein [Rhodospirillaceae bacterium]